MEKADTSSQLQLCNSVRLTAGEQALLFAALGSFILDVIINIIDYIGVQSSIIALFKGVIIAIILLNLRKKYSYYILFSLISIFFMRWLSLAMYGHQINIFFDLTYFLRILFFVTWLLLFNEKRDNDKFVNYFLILFIVVSSLNFICQFVGYLFKIDFFTAYGDQRAGYKGLFYGTNDTSIFYILAYFYSMRLLKERKGYIYPLFALAGLIVLCMGSKAALLGIVMVPVFYYYYVKKNKDSNNFMNFFLRQIKNIVLILFVLSVGYVVYAYVGIEELFLRINYTQFIDLIDKSDLVTAILSGRNYKVLDYFDSIKSVFDVLFGLQIKDIADYMVEIDLFDYLTRIGLIGTVLVMYLILSVTGLTKKNKFDGEIKALLIIIVLLGATAGHVLLSTINGIWIAFFLVFFSRHRMSKSHTNSVHSVLT